MRKYGVFIGIPWVMRDGVTSWYSVGVVMFKLEASLASTAFRAFFCTIM